MKKEVTVLGAGMVGVSCALALQKQGMQVTLIDRSEPGTETSHGNAGVITRSSLLAYNSPALWRSLPKFTMNRAVQLRYSMGYMLSHPFWIARYLKNTLRSQFLETATALDALIRSSFDLHKQWVQDSGIQQHWRDNGWLHLYRTEDAFATSKWARDLYQQYGVNIEVLNPEAIHELEPSLNPIFKKATWIKDTMSVDDPRAMVQAYAQLFAAQGGKFIKKDIRRISRSTNNAWMLQNDAGAALQTSCLVIALGPWVAEMLLPLGIRIPMAFERGYHQHYIMQDGAQLHRPVFDTGGGYVMNAMREGLRLSTGVELNYLNAPPRVAQLNMAEKSLKEAFPIIGRTKSEPWLGSRPTLPDCRPMIGETPQHKGLWLAVGHQHVGLNVGPGTGKLLAELMTNTTPTVDPAPFSPGRYL